MWVTLLLPNSPIFANGNNNWNTGGGDVKWRMDCDFPGSDIEQIEGPGEQCGSMCIAKHECTHFTHNKGLCFLKKAPLSTPHTILQAGSHVVCGFIPMKFEPGIMKKCYLLLYRNKARRFTRSRSLEQRRRCQMASQL